MEKITRPPGNREYIKHGRPFFISLCVVFTFVLSCMSCARHAEPAEHPEYFTPLLDRAWEMADSGMIMQAFAFLDSAYSHTAFVPGKYDRYRKYNFKAHYLIGIFRDYDVALVYVDSMLLMLEGKADIHTDDYLSTHMQKGFIFFNQNRYAEAYLYYYKGKMLAIEYNSQCQYAALTASLGRVTYRQGKYQDAIPFFREAFVQGSYCDTTEFLTTVHLRQEQLSNIGLCYEQLGLPDSAVWYYEYTLDFITQHEPRFPGAYRSIAMARGVIYGNLGSIYFKKGDYEKARYFLQQAIQINEQSGYDNYDALLNSIKLADLYLTTGRYTIAAQTMQQVRTALDSISFDEAELRWRMLAWRYYDILGDTKQAYRAHLHYTGFKDSFDAERRELPGMNYKVIFDNLSQQYQIGILQKDNRLKALYLVLTVLFSVMAVVVFFLIRKNYLQSKHNVVKLTALNRRITGQNMYLQQTLDALEHSQQEHTRIMKTVAHDLRNPVAAMVGIADLLLQESLNTPGQKEMIEMIKTSGMNAFQVMEDLLHDSDNLPVEVIALDELIDYSVELMRFRAAEKNQQLIVNLRSGYIRANRQKIWRVLNNLIVNAIKFTPQSKTITIGMETREEKILVTVRDEGIGIPDEVKAGIFEAVASARRTGTSGESSFGMGLAIAKQIIETYEGRIWFETEVGQGTVFYIEWPAASVPVQQS